MCSAWLRLLFVEGIGSKVPLASIIAHVLSILSLTRFSVAWSGKIFSSGIWVAGMVSLISQLSALGGEILLIVANAFAHILYSVFWVLVSYRRYNFPNVVKCHRIAFDA